MYLKIIFLTFTACVVNASVITLNNDDDELQTLDDFSENLSIRSCNYKECDQRCRRLKFPGGACVNGRCKCDNFRTSEDFAALIEEYTPRRCNPQECHQRCRRLKFPGGTCVNGRCKCDNFRNVENTVTLAMDSTDSFSAPKCVLRICSRVCRSLRFKNGTCINGRCKCVRKESSTTESPVTKISEADHESNMSVNEDFAALIEEYSPRRCSPQECNQRCRRLKFPGGTCVNGRCKCDNFRNAKDVVAESTELNLDPPKSLTMKFCKPLICDFLCRRKRFDSGSCINGRCECTRKEPSTTTTTTTTTESAVTQDSKAEGADKEIVA